MDRSLFTNLLAQRPDSSTSWQLARSARALAQDQLGALGGTRRPITALRVAAVALSFAGSLLTQESVE